ncbi:MULTISPECIES: ABC-F family ATP-binding cassette domain-containing protein [unclassified Crossiella]|uniref:ABC-F family ATP-binding cassette domain-containing protein n=1 Tax=unclassified Crossiella TaxID=2620835 RepID=UPI001FFFD695|nr:MULTISPECIES: ABC-F family ATP-binding cassette domain-containing protein [unclassified Crossiella]MCK2237020.1 ATP-binding cassette domain-containing protein [Crossiella sp. S99.2]MCK2250688.1 ATP-binding cassette domain-containing protein [Crossiella sp. S99.1]
MVNLVNLESVSKSYGVRPLLDAVSLGVSQGDRIGVVGLNGGGKTTLLEVLAGIEPPDEGRVSRSRDLRMAVVTQRSELPAGATVRSLVLDPLGFAAEHEWAADPKARNVMDGLGVTALGLDSPLEEMSGGERRRVALAAALVQELDLIVLDEPTNHLDVEGVRWLAEHLLTRRGALVVVTHDRWFLDTVCTTTWEVVGGKVEQYEGGYADWIFARAERARVADTLEEKRKNLARKELAWLRRGAPARTAKPRYRIEAAESLIADVPPPRDTVELVSFARRRLGKTVLEIENVDLSIPDRALLTDVTWRIGPGDRIGLVGVNGSGKTTLLRLLAGEREPEAGKRIQGQTVRLAHLSQELTDLPPTQRVLEAVEEVARRVTLGKRELSASQLAELFGFPAQRQWTPVGDLSGGERRRLQLARLLMAEPNVLLLDEPTNDLDIDTLQQLEDLLDSWPGTLVVVSHDRYLVERVCDQVVALFGDGKIAHLVGGIDEYLRRREESGQLGLIARATLAAAEPLAPAPAPTGPSAADTRAARKELARLERQFEKLAKREAELHAALAEAATDSTRLLKLDAELRSVLAEKSDVEEQWLLAADAAE